MVSHELTLVLTLTLVLFALPLIKNRQSMKGVNCPWEKHGNCRGGKTDYFVQEKYF